jgi:hypothetical protein
MAKEPEWRAGYFVCRSAFRRKVFPLRGKDCVARRGFRLLWTCAFLATEIRGEKGSENGPFFARKKCDFRRSWRGDGTLRKYLSRGAFFSLY